MSKQVVALVFCVFALGCETQPVESETASGAQPVICGDEEFLDGDTCRPLTSCGDQTYESVAPTAQTDRICSPLTLCNPGSFEIQAPTPLSDRVCASCTLGQDFSSEVNSAICTPTQNCGQGQYEVSAPTLSTDRVCGDCIVGEDYSQGINNPSCTPVQICVAGEYVVTVPTAISDRICGSCTLGQNYSTDVNTSSCSPVQNCHAGQYEIAAPTLIANRICGECILGVDYSQGMNSSSCMPVLDCAAGEYEVSEPTLVSNRTCGVCTLGQDFSTEINSVTCHPVQNCASGEYELASPTVSSDRICGDCILGQEFSSEINSPSCQPVTQCSPGTFAELSPTLTQDTLCTPCETGESFSEEWNAESCTGVTQCSINAYEVTPPSVTSDRVCETLRVSLAVLDDTAHEGGQEQAMLRVELSAIQNRDIDVFYSAMGTAMDGEDYLLIEGGLELAGSVTIPAGEAWVDVSVVPLVSAAMETEEWLEFSLENSVEYELEESQGLIWLMEFGPSFGQVYYVAEDGDDTASGEHDNPFATLAHAVSVLEAGDTVYLFDGTYTNANFTENHGADGTLQLGHGTVASVSASGDPDNWITIAAYPDGNDTKPLLRFDGSGGIEIKSGANFIVIDGLEIEGPNKDIHYDWAHEHRWSKENYYKGRGIFTWGPVHHIVVRNCDVHHTPGSGIRFNNSDYILVENNIVSNTTWWSSSAESGIVIATAQSIDTDESVKILYSGNIVYNNWNFLEFCSTPFRDSTEDVYGNCDDYTGGIIDGQGLYVTRNNDTYLHGRMRFENNIAFNNGYGGVVYHKTNRGELVNNLVFMNGAYPGITRYSGLTVNTADDLKIINNFVWARESDHYAVKNNGNATNVEATHNYFVGLVQFGSAEDNTEVAFDEAAPLETMFTRISDLSVVVPSLEQTGDDFSPAFIDAYIQSLELDFRPPGSIDNLTNAGTSDLAPGIAMDGVVRPQGEAVDIGPFEYVSEVSQSDP